MIKRAVLFLVFFSLLAAPVRALEPIAADALPIPAPSAILMEKTTGTVLFEKNAYAHLAPASVTKVMTMLLAAEAIDDGSMRLDETVTASARAAGMGGSQIWLEEGEQMSVGEMLKCIAVVSANDCCVALAEHMAGSEEAFVARMNRRAEELGLKDTHFTSCSGLSDSDDHYTCAHDLAVISRELIGHEMIKQYTTIWMDSIRDGKFGLSNTNKLIYHYPGATGLKTGFTSKAMYCLAATAQRDGAEYIAVVLHADSSVDRFESRLRKLCSGSRRPVGGAAARHGKAGNGRRRSARSAGGLRRAGRKKQGRKAAVRAGPSGNPGRAGRSRPGDRLALGLCGRGADPNAAPVRRAGRCPHERLAALSCPGQRAALTESEKTA